MGVRVFCNTTMACNGLKQSDLPLCNNFPVEATAVVLAQDEIARFFQGNHLQFVLHGGDVGGFEFSQLGGDCDPLHGVTLSHRLAVGVEFLRAVGVAFRLKEGDAVRGKLFTRVTVGVLLVDDGHFTTCTEGNQRNSVLDALQLGVVVFHDGIELRG